MSQLKERRPVRGASRRRQARELPYGEIAAAGSRLKDPSVGNRPTLKRSSESPAPERTGPSAEPSSVKAVVQIVSQADFGAFSDWGSVKAMAATFARSDFRRIADATASATFGAPKQFQPKRPKAGYGTKVAVRSVGLVPKPQRLKPAPARKTGEPQTRFVRLQQFAGRVREIHVAEGMFTAELKPAGTDDVLTTSFSLAELSDREQNELHEGQAFVWVLGRRELFNRQTQEVYRRKLEPVFVFRPKRVASSADIAEARARAKAARSRRRSRESVARA